MAPFLVLSCFALSLSGIAATAAEDPSQITYWYRNYDSRKSADLLRLALQKTTDLYGPYQISRGPEITQGRAVVVLRDGSRSVVTAINAVADTKRESQLRVVRFASEEGLIGWRVCIIRKDDQARFEGVRSHQGLLDRKIVFGQQSHWPDTDVLRANSLPVETSVRFESLMPMLKAGRFNCFLRGVGEAQEDLERYADNDLMIEETLLFSYPSASLFMVNENDTEVASRIELGLRRASLDGDLSAFFERHYHPVFVELGIAQRRVIRLNNPFISDLTLRVIAERPSLTDGKIDLY